MMFEFESKRVTIHGADKEFRVFRHPGAVAILAVNERGEVALLRQLRPAVDDYIWEIPAGTLEPGEDPAACASRELTEETGFSAQTIQPLGEFLVAPGYSSERLYMFWASGLTAGEQNLDPFEDIQELRWVSPLDIRHMISTGQIIDAKTIAGMYLLEMEENPS